MKRFTLFFSLLFVFFSASALGQDKKYSVNVFLEIQHDSKNVESEMYSYLARELRSLGDVNVVNVSDNDTRFFITVQMLDNVLKDGRKTGYILSFLIEERGFCNVPIPNKKGYNNIYAYLKNKDRLLITTDVDGLQIIARKIITKFDTEILEPERKTIKAAAAAYKESTKKKKKQ